MNDERIPLLAEKAIQEIGGFDIWYMPKPNAFIHKFAELIVRECINAASDPGDGLIEGATWHDGVRACVWSIQDKFGLDRTFGVE